VDIWHKNDPWMQANLIAYNQVRDYEEFDEKNEMIKAMFGKKGLG